jgi:hypothetical protein
MIVLPARAAVSLDTQPMAGTEPSAGASMAVVQAHLSGLHLEPRADCWRCQSASGPDGSTPTVTEDPSTD